MSITRKADIAIIGAGISGLSLATQLKRQNPKAAITLIGPGDLRNQRICTWLNANERAPALLNTCIDRDWDTWGFRDNAGTFHNQQAETSRYVAIDGKRFKAQLEEQAELLGVRRVHDSCVEAQWRDGGYQILCNHQTELSTHLVDTRPPAIPNKTIKQQFVGHIIRCDRPHKHSTPTLMDFTASPIANDGLTFIYSLPLSDHELLIEATTFSPTYHAHADYETCIKQWITNNLATTTAWTHIKTESGVLPMGPIEPINDSLVRCGIAGGAARASTGYSWHGTQRQLVHLTSMFSHTGKLSNKPVYSRRAQFMDAVFLRVLRFQPQAIYTLFIAMAQRLPGDTLAQFLCDEGGWNPCLQTIMAAPKWPFIRAMWRV